MGRVGIGMTVRLDMYADIGDLIQLPGPGFIGLIFCRCATGVAGSLVGMSLEINYRASAMPAVLVGLRKSAYAAFCTR